MAQMAQFTSLQQTQELNTKTDTLIANQTSLQSIGLLGKTVDVLTDSGVVTGTVSVLNLSNAIPQITLQPLSGNALPGLKVTQIQQVY
jgi:flagellar basal-body rod modification protein FlgD